MFAASCILAALFLERHRHNHRRHHRHHHPFGHLHDAGGCHPLSSHVPRPLRSSLLYRMCSSADVARSTSGACAIWPGTLPAPRCAATTPLPTGKPTEPLARAEIRRRCRRTVIVPEAVCPRRSPSSPMLDTPSLCSYRISHVCHARCFHGHHYRHIQHLGYDIQLVFPWCPR